jgi:type IV secretion system protein VirB10
MTTAAAPQQAAPAPPDVAIRTRPPSPKRLSRKVLLVGALCAGAVIAFALVNGLSERPNRHQGAEANGVAASGGPPESIQQAQSQYGADDLPRGRLDQALPSSEAELQPPADPLLANAVEQAPPGSTNAGASAPASATAPDAQAVAQASAILFKADRERAAVDDAEARLDSRLTPPRSRYEIQSGHVIPAALLTALNSDLPGRVIAQVTAPVYDSVTGDHLLIPQGARLIGAYESGTRYGDNRLLLAWNRLILPNGWSINLRDMNATDAEGVSGLRDRTDNHLDRLAGAIGLSAIISVIANESEDEDDEGSLSQSVGDAAAQQAAQTGARIVDRELSARPTLRVRAGAPVRVLVMRDIQLRPYAGQAH